MPTFDRERELHQQGFARVAGTDEAGRGPLAGPVVAGAAVLPLEFVREFGEGLNDSKQLKEKEREQLFAAIQDGAQWGLGFVSAREIDANNIRLASWEAMRRALCDLESRFSSFDWVLVDGLEVREVAWPWKRQGMIKGDARSMTIAAASILAKVARDRWMNELAREHPGYGFEKHKGYPTPVHLAALKKLGPCAEHRRTFGPVRALLGSS